MGADDGQAGFDAAEKLSEARVVVANSFTIGCEQGFHGRQYTGYFALTVTRAVVIERVTGVQHPSVAGVDRHAGMTARMAGQCDETDWGGNLDEFARGVEA